MINMTIEAIAEAVGGEIFGDNLPLTAAKGVVIDNRLVEKDYIFIAIKGNRVDGHTFVNKAYESGAMAAIVEQVGDYNGVYIKVESTEEALRKLAAYYRRQLDIPIVGIIGSVGKTSTKEMTASVLSQEYNVLKTKGNFNNDVGLPLTILSIKEEHTAAVVEMGISDFGEMSILGEIACPDVVVYTCIGECHLENLHSRDGVLKAKTEVFDYLNDNAAVIVNAADDKLATITANDLPAGALLVTYSGVVSSEDMSDKSDSTSAVGLHSAMYQATKLTNLGLEGTKVQYTDKNNDEGEFIVPLPGEHNVSNAMAALAAGYTLGMSKQHITDGIAAAATIAGRNNFIKAADITIIDDCYNANPMSMRAGLTILGMTTGRRIAVLGDMGELGADELSLHRELYKSVIDNNIDVIYTAGELAESIVKALKEVPEGRNITAKAFVGDTAKEDLVTDLIPIIQSGDTILVKASHFMDFPYIVEKLKETATSGRQDV